MQYGTKSSPQRVILPRVSSDAQWHLNWNGQNWN